jgi:hypothetical protein
VRGKKQQRESRVASEMNKKEKKIISLERKERASHLTKVLHLSFKTLKERTDVSESLPQSSLYKSVFCCCVTIAFFSVVNSLLLFVVIPLNTGIP